ncbi:molybdenum cofactor guanylyltransferase MobA [Photobacterium sp. R1]
MAVNKMNQNPVSFSVLLLAGGQGSRMGGQDKGLVPFRGRPLIASLHDVVRPLTDDLLISCNRNAKTYAAYCDRTLSDDVAGFPGPLAGILKGLTEARYDWLLLFPCDAPLLNQTLIDQMLAAASAQTPRPAMVRQGRQWQPMFSLIPKALLPELKAAWQSGERSLMTILKQHDVIAIDCDENDPRLQNVNTPQQLLNLHHD